MVGLLRGGVNAVSGIGKGGKSSKVGVCVVHDVTTICCGTVGSFQDKFCTQVVRLCNVEKHIKNKLNVEASRVYIKTGRTSATFEPSVLVTDVEKFSGYDLDTLLGTEASWDAWLAFFEQIRIQKESLASSKQVTISELPGKVQLSGLDSASANFSTPKKTNVFKVTVDPLLKSTREMDELELESVGGFEEVFEEGDASATESEKTTKILEILTREWLKVKANFDTLEGFILAFAQQIENKTANVSQNLNAIHSALAENAARAQLLKATLGTASEDDRECTTVWGALKGLEKEKKEGDFRWKKLDGKCDELTDKVKSRDSHMENLNENLRRMYTSHTELQNLVRKLSSPFKRSRDVEISSLPSLNGSEDGSERGDLLKTMKDFDARIREVEERGDKQNKDDPKGDGGGEGYYPFSTDDGDFFPHLNSVIAYAAKEEIPSIGFFGTSAAY